MWVVVFSFASDQCIFFALLLIRGEESVITASTPLPALNNHIFAYFRFNVVLLIAGLVLFPLFSLLGLRTFSLFSQSRRFQSRLLDGLALATLLFLVLLAVAARYAVNHQVRQSTRLNSSHVAMSYAV